jgi:predicted nucleic acid-binding protein
MAEIAVDANVLVGLLDRHDTLHARSDFLLRRLAEDKRQILLLDICVTEALSVLCRRAAQRRTNPPDLEHVFLTVRAWHDARRVTFVQEDIERYFAAILDVAQESRGTLNFNDAFLVVLQRERRIGDVASFDRTLDTAKDFRRVE